LFAEILCFTHQSHSQTHNNTGQIFYTPGIYHVRTMYMFSLPVACLKNSIKKQPLTGNVIKLRRSINKLV